MAAGLRVDGSPVVHGGIETELFAAFEPGPWSARLLYVGRIDPRKGVLNAVRAVAQLPEATLVIAGDGDDVHRRELEAEIAGVGIGHRVAFQRPRRDRLAQVYAAADAVIFPSLWEEPWGLVPLEAMAVGRPVVATGAGGSSEYIATARTASCSRRATILRPWPPRFDASAATRPCAGTFALTGLAPRRSSAPRPSTRASKRLVAAVEDGTG